MKYRVWRLAHGLHKLQFRPWWWPFWFTFCDNDGDTRWFGTPELAERAFLERKSPIMTLVLHGDEREAGREAE